MRRLDDVVLWEGCGEDAPDPVCVELQRPPEGKCTGFQNQPDLMVSATSQIIGIFTGFLSEGRYFNRYSRFTYLQFYTGRQEQRQDSGGL